MNESQPIGLALLSITAVGGNDGRRPLLMGAVAQAGVGFFYAHLDRWVSLYDNQSLGKPIRIRDPKTDSFDDAGEIHREGRVDVLARLQEDRLVLYHGAQVGKGIISKQDVARREEYNIDPIRFRHFAEACRLTAANERALGRLVAEIVQSRRVLDPASTIVNIDL